MDTPVKKRGRPRKEEQSKRGRKKSNLDTIKKSETSQTVKTGNADKEKDVGNSNANEQKQSGEIKTRSSVKNSGRRKKQKISDSSKNSQTNTVKKLKSSNSSQPKNDKTDLTKDAEVKQSTNLEKMEIFPGLKKAEMKESELKQEVSKDASTDKKLDAAKEDETSDDSNTETDESDTDKEMPDLDLNIAIKEESETQKEMPVLDPNNSSHEVPGAMKEIPISQVVAVENKQAESSKKTDVKIRTSVYTFTTNCDRQRGSTGILTKKPISLVARKRISTITMKYTERNRKVAKSDESQVVSKDADTVGHDSNFIIIQKKVPEKQNLADTNSCANTKAVKDDEAVTTEKTVKVGMECKGPETSKPRVKTGDAKTNENISEIATVQKEEPEPQNNSSLPSTSIVVHSKNSDVSQNQEIPPTVIKKEPGQEESEHLLTKETSLKTQDSEKTRDDQKIDSLSERTEVTKPELEIKESAQETEIDVPKTDSSVEKLEVSEPVAERKDSTEKTKIDVLVTDSPVEDVKTSETDTERKESAEEIRLDVLETDSPVKDVETSESEVERKEFAEETSLDVLVADSLAEKIEISEPEIERQEYATETKLDVAKIDSPVATVEAEALESEEGREESAEETELDRVVNDSIQDVATILSHKEEILEEKTQIPVIEEKLAKSTESEVSSTESAVVKDSKSHIAEVDIEAIHSNGTDITETEEINHVTNDSIQDVATIESHKEEILDHVVNDSTQDVAAIESHKEEILEEKSQIPVTEEKLVKSTEPEICSTDSAVVEHRKSDIDIEAIHSNETDFTETEEITDMVPEEKTETLAEEEDIDMGESTKIKMQPLEEAVLHYPEYNSKSFQAVKDNNLDSCLLPTRLYNLPECSVVLHRLTDEDLQKSYPSESEDSYESYEPWGEGMNISRRNDSNLRSVRRYPKEKEEAFKIYKQKRERYMNKRNRAYHSENSLDLSQDESRTFSDGAKPKKKIKRGRRYERDFEWRPDAPKGIINSDRKLRRRANVIESDSSSSSVDDDDYEEDFMYGIYAGYEGIEENGESLDTVPSENANSTTFVKNDSAKHSISHQNSSQSSELKSPLQKTESLNYDIVSDILRSMTDQHKNISSKTTFKTFQHNSTMQSNDLKRTEQKKLKRPLSRMEKSSEKDPDKVVGTMLKEIVNKVSSKFKKHLQKDTDKPKKICKWCATPFEPNRSSDIKCAICTDLGYGEVSKSLASSKKTLTSAKMKCLKESKGKKSSSAMLRVLKNLSQNEKQRLIYSEKSDKMNSYKGYNHCKSFVTPKDSFGNSDSNVNSSQNKIPNEFSSKGNKLCTKPNKKTNKSDVNINNNTCRKTPVNIKPKISTDVEKNENKQNKSCVSLENYKKGLFLMTFPDPDEEINFEDKPSQSQMTKSGIISDNSTNLNGKQPATTESISPTIKQSQSVSTKKYDTFLFPPIPTVIVSNYCSDTSSLNLSHTYFQNEITHQRAIKNSPPSSVNSVVTLNNTIVPMSGTVSFQNSSINSSRSNNPTPITTFPINSSNLNQITIKSVSSLNSEVPANNVTIMPKPSVSMTILPKPSVPTGSMPKTSVSVSNILPKVSVPINNMAVLSKTHTTNKMTVLSKASIPVSNITILPIVTSVISLSDKNAAQTERIKENLPSSFSTDNFVNSQLSDIKINKVTSLKDDQSLLNSETTMNKITNKRSLLDPDNECASAENVSHSSAKRIRLNSDRCSSGSTEAADEENAATDSSVILRDNTGNTTNENQCSILPERERSVGSINNEQTEQQSSNSGQSDKSSGDKENAAPQSAISVTQSAIDLLGAISILAVIDLEKNPHTGLNARIQQQKKALSNLTNQKISTPEHNEKVLFCQYNLELLNIAKRYLSIYGTFAKVSEHLLRKANMIQIKKELHEEETNQNSCMFSQPSNISSPFSERQSDISKTVEISHVNQMQNFTSRPNGQATINHIEKLKSQIAAMNNVNVDLSQYGSFPGGGTVHHYPGEQIPVLNPAVAAPTPITPRNDCLGNESRETPSRGSGPRTPARPESAASQSEDTTSLIQVKKEQFETTTSPSQCAYAQNTTLPQISSQLPVMPEMSPLTITQQSIANTPVHLPVSNSNQVYTNQTNYNVHSNSIMPNRTVAYSHQNYSDMYLNVAPKPQMQMTPATASAKMRQNHQMMLGQQMYIQNGSGLCSKQAVPSINNNQYVIRPPYTSSNTGGTLIVNNTQVGQNALLTNVSNQQFYTSNQVPQLYYPPSAQMSCMSSNNMPTMITPDVTAAQVQQAEIESPEQMICAVCNKQATLRCKQCARVAYCNTACAKTYWHQKHKMECKPIGS